MLNVLAGGALHSDLSRSTIAPIRRHSSSASSVLQRIFCRVPVQVDPQLRLAEITGKPELRVNSIHSQAIDRLGVGFIAVAQAIEHTRDTFLIGVQFHPEFLVYGRFARGVPKLRRGGASARHDPRRPFQRDYACRVQPSNCVEEAGVGSEALPQPPGPSRHARRLWR
jgi:putative glutamine amidotransferase